MWMKNQEHRIVPSTVLSPDELLGSAGSLALLLTLTHSGLSRQAVVSSAGPHGHTADSTPSWRPCVNHFQKSQSGDML